MVDRTDGSPMSPTEKYIIEQETNDLKYQKRMESMYTKSNSRYIRADQ